MRKDGVMRMHMPSWGGCSATQQTPPSIRATGELVTALTIAVAAAVVRLRTACGRWSTLRAASATRAGEGESGKDEKLVRVISGVEFVIRWTRPKEGIERGAQIEPGGRTLALTLFTSAAGLHAIVAVPTAHTLFSSSPPPPPFRPCAQCTAPPRRRCPQRARTHTDHGDSQSTPLSRRLVALLTLVPPADEYPATSSSSA